MVEPGSTSPRKFLRDEFERISLDLQHAAGRGVVVIEVGDE